MQYKNSKNQHQKITGKKLLFVSITVIALILLLLLILEKTGVTNIYTKNTESTQTIQDEGYINYNPPTTEEQQAGNTVKENINSENEPQQLPNTAEVVIVDANQYENVIEVRAFVSNVIENGSCKYIFTQNSSEIIKEQPAYADASTTPCTNLEVNRSEFPTSGQWNVEVIYTSTTIAGSSEKEFTIE